VTENSSLRTRHQPAIDKATGKLSKLKEYPVGKNPNWVEIVSFSR
jgi:6-phosphogluconolactonase (cycloisomerase 2 family)